MRDERRESLPMPSSASLIPHPSSLIPSEVEGEPDMAHARGFLGQFLRRAILPALAVAAGLALLLAASRGDETKAQLRIGNSNPITGHTGTREEKGAVRTLQSFIKDEIGMTNTIVQTKDWRELAVRMAKGKLQVGVFQ